MDEKSRIQLLSIVFKSRPELLQLPVPRIAPNLKRKSHYTLKKFERIERYVEKLPDDLLLDNFDTVVKEITKTCVAEVQKIRAIYHWIKIQDLEVISSTTQQMKPSSICPLLFFSHIANGSTSFYSLLFEIMLRFLNIVSLSVEGYIKDLMFEPGDKVDRSKHIWNIAFVTDSQGHHEWHLFDVATDAENYHGFSYTDSRRTSQQSFSRMSEDSGDRAKSAGSSKSGVSTRRRRDTLKRSGRHSFEVEDLNASRLTTSDQERPLSAPSTTKARSETLFTDIHHLIDDAYFSPAPFDMIKTHYPLKPEYQLQAYPMTLAQFEALPVTRDIFPSLNLSLKGSSGQPIVRTADGEVELGFSYKLSRLLNFNVGLMRWGLLKSQDTGNTCYITKIDQLENTAEVTVFARLPSPGEYRLSLEAAPVAFGHYMHIKPREVACFKVIWDGATSNQSESSNHLPIMSCTGFGPVNPQYVNNFSLDQKLGFGRIFCEDGLLELSFKAKSPSAIDTKFQAQVLYYDSQWKETVSIPGHLCVLEKNFPNNSIQVKVHFPHHGEFALKIDQFSDTSQIWINFCNYLIYVQQTKDEPLRNVGNFKEVAAVQTAFEIPTIVVTFYEDENLPFQGNVLNSIHKQVESVEQVHLLEVSAYDASERLTVPLQSTDFNDEEGAMRPEVNIGQLEDSELFLFEMTTETDDTSKNLAHIEAIKAPTKSETKMEQTGTEKDKKDGLLTEHSSDEVHQIETDEFQTADDFLTPEIGRSQKATLDVTPMPSRPSSAVVEHVTVNEPSDIDIGTPTSKQNNKTQNQNFEKEMTAPEKYLGEISGEIEQEKKMDFQAIQLRNEIDETRSSNSDEDSHKFEDKKTETKLESPRSEREKSITELTELEKQKSLPGTEGHKSIPRSESQKSLPVSEGRKSIPRSESQTSLPVSEGRKSIPRSESQKSLPVSEGRKSIPRSESQKSLPVSEGRKSIPRSESQKSLPVSEGRKSIPRSEGRKSITRSGSQKSHTESEGQKSIPRSEGRKSILRSDSQKSNTRSNSRCQKSAGSQGQQSIVEQAGKPSISVPHSEISIRDADDQRVTPESEGENSDGQQMIPESADHKVIPRSVFLTNTENQSANSISEIAGMNKNSYLNDSFKSFPAPGSQKSSQVIPSLSNGSSILKLDSRKRERNGSKHSDSEHSIQNQEYSVVMGPQVGLPQAILTSQTDAGSLGEADDQSEFDQKPEIIPRNISALSTKSLSNWNDCESNHLHSQNLVLEVGAQMVSEYTFKYDNSEVKIIIEASNSPAEPPGIENLKNEGLDDQSVASHERSESDEKSIDALSANELFEKSSDKISEENEAQIKSIESANQVNRPITVQNNLINSTNSTGHTNNALADEIEQSEERTDRKISRETRILNENSVPHPPLPHIARRNSRKSVGKTSGVSEPRKSMEVNDGDEVNERSSTPKPGLEQESVFRYSPDYENDSGNDRSSNDVQQGGLIETLDVQIDKNDAKPVSQTSETTPFNQKPEIQSVSQIADTKTASQKSDTKPASQKSDTKPASQKSETKPASQKSETKPASQTSDTKPASQTSDTKPASPESETKPAPQKVETKPVSQKSETKPASQKPETKPASQKSETKPASQKSETKPASQTSDTKPASQKSETKPASQKSESKPISQKSETKPASQKSETKPDSQKSKNEQARENESQTSEMGPDEVRTADKENRSDELVDSRSGETYKRASSLEESKPEDELESNTAETRKESKQGNEWKTVTDQTKVVRTDTSSENASSPAGTMEARELIPGHPETGERSREHSPIQNDKNTQSESEKLGANHRSSPGKKNEEFAENPSPTMESLLLPIDGPNRGKHRLNRRRSTIEKDQKVLDEIIKTQSHKPVNEGKLTSRTFVSVQKPNNFESSAQLADYAERRREIYEQETARVAQETTGGAAETRRGNDVTGRKSEFETKSEDQSGFGIEDRPGTPLFIDSADEEEAKIYELNAEKLIDIEDEFDNFHDTTEVEIIKHQKILKAKPFHRRAFESARLQTTPERVQRPVAQSQTEIAPKTEEIKELEEITDTYTQAEEIEGSLKVKSIRPNHYARPKVELDNFLSEDFTKIVENGSFEVPIAVSLEETIKKGTFRKSFRTPWQLDVAIGEEFEMEGVPEFERALTENYTTRTIIKPKKKSIFQKKVQVLDRRPIRFQDPNYLNKNPRDFPEELKRPQEVTDRFRREMKKLKILDESSMVDSSSTLELNSDTDYVNEADQIEQTDKVNKQSKQLNKQEQSDVTRNTEISLVVKMNRTVTKRMLYQPEKHPLHKETGSIFVDPVGKNPMQQEPFRHKTFNRNLARELKSYRKPGSVVKSILKATFIVLGEPPLCLDDWEILSGLLSPSLYKDSLTVRMQNFQAEDLSPTAKESAQRILSQIQADDIERISKPVKVLLEWVSSKV